MPDAQVALERGDERTAYLEAKRALALDPDNPMASHLTMRMAEILQGRGEEVPTEVPVPTEAPAAEVSPAATDPAAKTRGLTDRLLRRRR